MKTLMQKVVEALLDPPYLMSSALQPLHQLLPALSLLITEHTLQVG